VVEVAVGRVATQKRDNVVASSQGSGCVRLDRGEDFDDFVRARLPSLVRFGRALTGSDAAAADLVQDALERTLVRWPRVISHGGDPEGYVRRVMVTRNISAWRRVRRERLAAEVPERVCTDPEPAWDSALWGAVVTLPPRQRAVIALRYYEDLSEAEIADLMGISPGTVKSQASHALAKLRSALQASGSQDDKAEAN